MGKKMSFLQSCPHCGEAMDKEDTRCTRCGKLISEQPEIINNKFNANQTAERRVEYEYDNDYDYVPAARSNPLNILLPIILVVFIIGGFFFYDSYQKQQAAEQERLRQIELQNKLELQLKLEQQALERQKNQELMILNTIMEERRKIERRKEINDAINNLGCLAGNQWQC